jgi:hypothetical protein
MVIADQRSQLRQRPCAYQLPSTAIFSTFGSIARGDTGANGRFSQHPVRLAVVRGRRAALYKGMVSFISNGADASFSRSSVSM